jgi:hypothetical protein
MGNLSLQRGPWNFWNSQTSPPDISLLLPPLTTAASRSVLLLPPPFTADATPRAPPPAAVLIHASFPYDPDPFPLPWWLLPHTPRRSRAISGRHLFAVVDSPLQCLNFLPLARSSTTSTPTCCSATSRVQFPVTELHSAAAVPFHSGRAQSARGQPTPDLLRPSQLSHQLPRDLLMLDDPLILPNFHWSPVLDERRRRRLRPPPWAARSRYSHTTTTP